MTWFRVDDSFSDHAKVVALQESKHWKGAIALWTLAGSWTSKHERDGFVPSVMVRKFGASPAEAEALVDVGLWVVADEGYRFHDWAGCNPTRATLVERRNGTAERQRRHRAGNGNASTATDVTRDRNVAQRVVTHSRPVPSRPEDPPLPPGGARPDFPDREPAAPLSAAGSAHGAEAREGWAAAWSDARAGTCPVLTGQTHAAAVEFARRVATAQKITLYESAKAIAAHVIAHGKRGRDDAFDLARMDPFAGGQSQSGAKSGAANVPNAAYNMRALP